MKRILYFSALLFCAAAFGCNHYERAPKPEPATSEARIHAKLNELEGRVIRLQIKMALARQLTPPLLHDELGTPLAVNHKKE